MQTKLTLRLDERLIRKAKSQAARHGKSLSELVASYFVILCKHEVEPSRALTPTVRSLKGILSRSKKLKGAASKEHYKRHLEEKYL